MADEADLACVDQAIMLETRIGTARTTKSKARRFAGRRRAAVRPRIIQSRTLRRGSFVSVSSEAAQVRPARQGAVFLRAGRFLPLCAQSAFGGAHLRRAAVLFPVLALLRLEHRRGRLERLHHRVGFLLASGQTEKRPFGAATLLQAGIFSRAPDKSGRRRRRSRARSLSEATFRPRQSVQTRAGF